MRCNDSVETRNKIIFEIEDLLYILQTVPLLFENQ